MNREDVPGDGREWGPVSAGGRSITNDMPKWAFHPSLSLFFSALPALLRFLVSVVLEEERSARVLAHLLSHLSQGQLVADWPPT